MGNIQGYCRSYFNVFQRLEIQFRNSLNVREKDVFDCNKIKVLIRNAFANCAEGPTELC